MSSFHPLHFSSSYTTAHRLLGTSTHLLRVKMPAWMLLTLNRRRMEMMLFMIVIVDCHWFNGMCQNDIKKTKLANQEYVTCITLLSFLLLTKNVSKMPLEILRLFNFFLCETMNINIKDYNSDLIVHTDPTRADQLICTGLYLKSSIFQVTSF